MEAACLEQLKDALGPGGREVNAFFLHHLDNEGIDGRGRFKTGAGNLQMVACKAFEKRFGHLAAAAVVLTDEKNAGFFGHGPFGYDVSIPGAGCSTQAPPNILFLEYTGLTGSVSPKPEHKPGEQDR